MRVDSFRVELFPNDDPQNSFVLGNSFFCVYQVKNLPPEMTTNHVHAEGTFEFVEAAPKTENCFVHDLVSPRSFILLEVVVMVWQMLASGRH